MKLIESFSSLGRGDADKAGGKGASLGEMTQAGIPVPPGFVVLADAFEHFIEQTDLVQEIDSILHTVNHEEMHTVENASAKIQGLILNAEMPADLAEDIKKEFAQLGAMHVAVRSSATAEDSSAAAWAGQLDSFLNTTEETLLKNVQRCWASLFTPRAIFYRFEKALHNTKISVAVVVQKMVASEISGIAFSVHPVTEDYNQLIIEAGLGLGEAIVSGQITPDSYVVEKEPRRVLDINVSTQERALHRAEVGGNEWREVAAHLKGAQVLTEPQILELAALILRIEQHYGFPCDIEWAYEEGKFYIVQSRPITTLSPKTQTEGADSPVAHYFQEPMVKRGEWTLLPADMETWMAERTSSYFEEYFGFPKGHPNIYSAQTGRMTNYTPAGFYTVLHDYIRNLTSADAKGIEKKARIFSALKRETREKLADAGKIDPASLSNADLAEAYEANRDLIHRVVAFDHFGMEAEGYWPPLMHDILTKKLGLTPRTPEYHEVLFTLSKPAEISTSLLERRACIEGGLGVRSGQISAREAAEKLAEEFGWMPVFAYGTPWDADHYIEELETLAARDEAELRREADALARYSALREEAIGKVVTEYGIAPEDLQIFIDFGCAVDMRNEAEFVVSLGGYYLLPLYAEMAHRLGVSLEELRLLYESEIVPCLHGNADARTLLAGKGAYIGWGFTPDMRERINLTSAQAGELFTYLEAHATVAGQEQSEPGRGVCASSGKARGTARLLVGPKENGKVQQGDILISYATTVDYLPAMGKAAAIVTETGGLTCHAAVVSREFGIPCVVGFKDAMTTFKDGDLVEVDADKGVVRKLGADGIVPASLSKVFSREKDLFYLCVWNESDRVGAGYFDETLLHNLFIARPKGQKGEVWYEQQELDRLKVAVIKKLNGPEGPSLMEKLQERNAQAWNHLFPYVREEKSISDFSELKSYFENLVAFWTTMNSFIWEAQESPEMSAEFKRIFVSWREATERHSEKASNIITDYVARAYPELGELSWVMSFKELEDYVSGTLTKEDIARMKRERTDGCYMLNGSVGPLGELARTLDAAHLELERADTAGISELSGTIGYAGHAAGKAIIVHGFEDLARVGEGAVLITQMTNPKYLPALHKAVAVVTDEGGALCHAAIVAREMKKPCVIGTKFATQVFKDGDLVEVDADKGVVRILRD